MSTNKPGSSHNYWAASRQNPNCARIDAQAGR
jgi:hypothetical protein